MLSNTIRSYEGIRAENTGYSGSGSDSATQTVAMNGNSLNSGNSSSYGMGIYLRNIDLSGLKAEQTVTVSGAHSAANFEYGLFARSDASATGSAQSVTVSGLTATGLPGATNTIIKCGSGTQTVTVGSGNTGNGSSVTTAQTCVP